MKAAKPVTLTVREDEILKLAGKGLTNKEIGLRLEISDLTVKKHMEHITAKLNQPNRIKAFLAASEKALLTTQA